jgi:UDP-GlcNAc:undecaprenyl-phosphate GlcNAc-1-phosphate transferase
MLILLGLTLLISAVVISALLCGIVRGIARRARFVDEPAERKIHTEPIALGGGIGFVATTGLIVMGGTLFAILQGDGEAAAWLPDLIRRHIPAIIDRSGLVFYVLGGAAVLFLVGLMDDLWQLSPWVRLAVQAAVAAVLWFACEELRVTVFMGADWVSFVYTVLWIVGMTNAFNLLDNMDGLSAGVAVIASAMFLVVAILTQQYFLAAMLLVFAGSLLGFLVFNFPPASLFMGDAGSTFIGYMLGTLTILFTFYSRGSGHNPVSAIVVPLVILAVPLYDTISVVAIRLASGKPIFGADKNHFSHRLVALGMGTRAAVLTIYLVTLCTGLLAPLLLRLEIGMSLLVFGNVFVMLVLVWLLEHAGRRGRDNSPGNSH